MEMANRTRQRNPVLNNLRIILTLAQKDIAAMLRSRAVLTTLIMVLLMIVFYTYLPVWAESSDPPRVWVLGLDDSFLARSLPLSPTLRADEPRDLDRMMNLLRESQTPEIGIILPADLSLTGGNEPLVLQGYVMYWLNPQQVAELTEAVELELSSLLDRPVHVAVDGNILYPQVGNYGMAATAGFSLVFALTMIGVAAIPQLMMEEKQNHTLQALLVSPATPTMIILAKALAGGFFIGAAFLFSMGFFGAAVLQWWLMLLATLLFGTFAVSIGLFGGTWVENRQQLALLIWGAVPVIFVSMIAFLLEGLLPDWLIGLVRLLPGAAMIEAISLAFVKDLPLSAVVLPLGVLALWALGLLVLVIWRLQRYDR